MLVKIKDYYPNVYDRYYISDEGILYTDYGHKQMSDKAIQNGYIVNSLYGENNYRKDIRRHVLVATIFCKKESDKQNQINHKDGNKLNNKADNLEWCTSKENIDHAWQNNLSHTRKGSASNLSKLNEQQVLEILQLLKENKMTGRKIAELYKVAPSTISAIKNGHNWKNLK